MRTTRRRAEFAGRLLLRSRQTRHDCLLSGARPAQTEPQTPFSQAERRLLYCAHAGTRNQCQTRPVGSLAESGQFHESRTTFSVRNNAGRSRLNPIVWACPLCLGFGSTLPPPSHAADLSKSPFGLRVLGRVAAFGRSWENAAYFLAATASFPRHLAASAGFPHASYSFGIRLAEAFVAGWASPSSRWMRV